MKNLKKVVSIVLSLVMLSTMLPAVFAASVENSGDNSHIWFEWNGGSQPSVYGNGYNSTHKNEWEIGVVDRAGEDKAFQVKSIVADGTNPTTHKAIGFVLDNEKGRTASKFFVSYDINFTEISANTSGNKVNLLEQPIIPQKGNTAQHSGKFITDDGLGTGFAFDGSAADLSFNLKSWYNIRQEFDLENFKEKIIVTPENGESVVAVEGRHVSSWLSSVYDVRFAANQASVYMIDNVKIGVCENSISIDSPQLDVSGAEYSVKDKFSFTTTINGDFDAARVISGGDVVQTFTQGDKNTYNITIDADDSKYIGENEIAIEVDFKDGTTKRYSKKYKTYSNPETNVLRTDMSKAPTDFPSKGSFTADNVKNLWKKVVVQDVMHDDSWDVKKNTFKMVDSAGEGINLRNGKFMQITNTADSTDKTASVFTKYNASVKTSTGKIKATYIVYVTSGAMTPILNFRWVGGTTNNEFTMSNLVANVWNKLTVELDLDNDKIRYLREADGVADYTSGPSSFTSNLELNQLKFDFKFTEPGQSYFIESINVDYITNSKNTLSLTSYTMPDNTTTLVSSTEKPHSGAHKLTLTASGELVLSDGSALYNAEGKIVEGTSFTANGNTVDVLLPSSGIPEGKYKLALGSATTLNGASVGGKLSADVEFVNNKGFVLLSPAAYVKTEGTNISLKLAAPDAVKVKAYIDGKLIGTKSRSESGIYAFEAEAEYGLREAVLVAENSDKSKDVASSKINLYASSDDIGIKAVNNGDTINVELDADASVNENDVELYVNGVKKVHAGVNVNNKVLSITLPDDLKDNKEIKVVLKNTISGLSQDASVVAYTAGKNGFYVGLADFDLTKGEFNGTLYLVGTSNVTLSKVYIAAYEGNEMVAVDAFDITPREGLSFEDLGFDITDATSKVKVMVWDTTSQTPLMTAPECSR